MVVVVVAWFLFGLCWKKNVFLLVELDLHRDRKITIFSINMYGPVFGVMLNPKALVNTINKTPNRNKVEAI
jgi:hypothetical protein